MNLNSTEVLPDNDIKQQPVINSMQGILHPGITTTMSALPPASSLGERANVPLVLVHPTAPCGCPLRAAPPGMPECLPFDPVKENTEDMKVWLLNRYAASTFNICPHQELPKMSGPPMKLLVNNEAPLFQSQFIGKNKSKLV